MEFFADDTSDEIRKEIENCLDYEIRTNDITSLKCLSDYFSEYIDWLISTI